MDNQCLVISLDAFRSDRVIQYLTEVSQPTASRSYLERYEARFGADNDSLDWYRSQINKSHSEPYIGGCVHNIQWRTIDPKRWNRPMPFAVEVSPESAVIGSKVPVGGTDPLMWMDRKYQAALNHIKTRAGRPLVINTRSDLIAHDDYLEALDRDHHEINIHVLTDDSKWTLLLEPGCPSTKRRVIAYKKLKSLGFKVNLIHDQLNLNGEILPLTEVKANRINKIKLTPRARQRVQLSTGVSLKVS